MAAASEGIGKCSLGKGTRSLDQMHEIAFLTFPVDCTGWTVSIPSGRYSRTDTFRGSEIYGC